MSAGNHLTFKGDKMFISGFSTKDAMLVWAEENLDRTELRDLAKMVNDHCLTTCEVPERSNPQDILLSLKNVSKAILWSCLQEFLDDEDEDQEDFNSGDQEESDDDTFEDE